MCQGGVKWRSGGTIVLSPSVRVGACAPYFRGRGIFLGMTDKVRFSGRTDGSLAAVRPRDEVLMAH